MNANRRVVTACLAASLNETSNGEGWRTGSHPMHVASPHYELAPRVEALALLRVVLLPVDVTARAILAPVQVAALALRHFAIGFGRGLFGVRHRLLALHAASFAARQLAAAHALTNAPLLMALAPVYSRRILRERGDAHAEHKNSGQYHTNDSLHAVLLKELTSS
jgi:hypothetical protein